MDKKLIKTIIENMTNEDLSKQSPIKIDNVEYYCYRVETLVGVNECGCFYQGNIWAIQQGKASTNSKNIFYVRQNSKTTGYYNPKREYEKPYQVVQKEITTTIWGEVK